MNFKLLYESLNIKTIDDVIKLIKKDLKTVVQNTVKASGGGNSKAAGINIGKKFIAFRTDGDVSSDFEKFANAIKEQKDKLEDAIQSIKDDKTRNFWNTVLIKYINNPKSIPTESKAETNEKNKGKGYTEPGHYAAIGEALVYRSSEFISKMADSKTEIDKNTFNQLMIDAFNAEGKNGGTSENLLNTITNMDEMMRIDAAKKTVCEQNENGDADKKLGSEQQDENYYSNLKNELNILLTEDTVKVPRKLGDFSDNKKTLLAQVDAVEKTWPRQFKKNFEMYQAKFEDGVKKGQDEVRKNDSKEVTDPLTGKKLPGRKGWGSGGPNAFIRDHEYINKLCQGIKTDKLTIFNLGPRMILGIFDMLEHGGKILQGIKDEFGEAFKDIKKAFSSGSTSSKEFNDQIDELIKEEQYGAAYATSEAAAIVSFTQLLALLQNGPIGTVDLENHTFTTAMSNSQTSIEVAIQNLLASLDKYTDTAKRYEENKDVTVNDEQSDAVIKDGKEDKKEDNGNKSEDDDGEEDLPAENSSYRPKLSLKKLLLSEDNNEDAKNGDDKKEEKKEEKKETQEDSANQTLSQLDMIKSNFEDNCDPARLKEVLNVLNSFKGKGDLKDKEGKEVDFSTFDKIVDLYDTLANENLKFNLDAANLKDFLEGIKSYIEDYKEIEPIENLTIYLDENSKKFPAMEATGELKVAESGKSQAADLAKLLDSSRKSVIDLYISKLDTFAKVECKDDSWLKAYEKKSAELDKAFDTVVKNIQDVYKEDTPDWIKEYAGDVKNSNYLTKLYLIMACLTTLVDELKNLSSDKKEGEGENDDGEEDLPQEPKKESYLPKLRKPKLNEKTKILFRSLYLTEEDNSNNDNNNNNNNNNQSGEQQNNKQVNAGENNPSMENGHNEEQARKGGKQEPVQHSVAELWKRIEAVKLNDALLPTNPDADVYKKNDPKEFNRLSDAFANNATGLSITKGTDGGNGIVSILRNILTKFKEQSQKNAEIIKKANCAQLASIFLTGDDKNRDTSDLYLYFGCACGIAKVLKANLSEIQQNFDNKNGEGEQNDESDENQENGEGNENGENQQNAGNQENNNENNQQETKPQQNSSYQYPNVSPDSFLNEIYKYIRG